MDDLWRRILHDFYFSDVQNVCKLVAAWKIAYVSDGNNEKFMLEAKTQLLKVLMCYIQLGDSFARTLYNKIASAADIKAFVINLPYDANYYPSCGACKYTANTETYIIEPFESSFSSAKLTFSKRPADGNDGKLLLKHSDENVNLTNEGLTLVVAFKKQNDGDGVYKTFHLPLDLTLIVPPETSSDRVGTSKWLHNDKAREIRSGSDPNYISSTTDVTFCGIKCNVTDFRLDKGLRKSYGKSILTIGYDAMPPFYRLPRELHQIPSVFYPFVKIPVSGYFFNGGTPFFASLTAATDTTTNYLQECLCNYKSIVYGAGITALLSEPCFDATRVLDITTMRIFAYVLVPSKCATLASPVNKNGGPLTADTSYDEKSTVKHNEILEFAFDDLISLATYDRVDNASEYILRPCLTANALLTDHFLSNVLTIPDGTNNVTFDQFKNSVLSKRTLSINSKNGAVNENAYLSPETHILAIRCSAPLFTAWDHDGKKHYFLRVPHKYKKLLNTDRSNFKSSPLTSMEWCNDPHKDHSTLLLQTLVGHLDDDKLTMGFDICLEAIIASRMMHKYMSMFNDGSIFNRSLDETDLQQQGITAFTLSDTNGGDNTKLPSHFAQLRSVDNVTKLIKVYRNLKHLQPTEHFQILTSLYSMYYPTLESKLIPTSISCIRLLEMTPTWMRLLVVSPMIVKICDIQSPYLIRDLKLLNSEYDRTTREYNSDLISAFTRIEWVNSTTNDAVTDNELFSANFEDFINVVVRGRCSNHNWVPSPLPLLQQHHQQQQHRQQRRWWTDRSTRDVIVAAIEKIRNSPPQNYDEICMSLFDVNATATALLESGNRDIFERCVYPSLLNNVTIEQRDLEIIKRFFENYTHKDWDEYVRLNTTIITDHVRKKMMETPKTTKKRKKRSGQEAIKYQYRYNRRFSIECDDDTE